MCTSRRQPHDAHDDTTAYAKATAVVNIVARRRRVCFNGRSICNLAPAVSDRSHARSAGMIILCRDMAQVGLGRLGYEGLGFSYRMRILIATAVGASLAFSSLAQTTPPRAAGVTRTASSTLVNGKADRDLHAHQRGRRRGEGDDLRRHHHVVARAGSPRPDGRHRARLRRPGRATSRTTRRTSARSSDDTATASRRRSSRSMDARMRSRRTMASTICTEARRASTRCSGRAKRSAARASRSAGRAWTARKGIRET